MSDLVYIVKGRIGLDKNKFISGARESKGSVYSPGTVMLFCPGVRSICNCRYLVSPKGYDIIMREIHLPSLPGMIT